MPGSSRRLLIVAACAIAALGAVFALSRPGGAAAHPLGNFTVNHYSRIDVMPEGITLFRVLDMAEIPAFQARQEIDVDGDGSVSGAESAAYSEAAAAELLDNIELQVNGRRTEPRETSREIQFPPGQGGLSLLRLEVTYVAPLPDGWREGVSVHFADSNFPDRIGWREVIVRAGSGVELAASDVPSTDISDELRAYPADSLSAPLDVRGASFSVRPGAGAPLPQRDGHEERATRGNPDSTLGRFAGLIARDELNAGVITLALLAAVGFGAIHALSPGHGKTVVAAYLVGSRGTAKHALLLAATVTLTHTSSVYLLGFVTLYLSQYILPEELYPWLGIASGAIVLALGVALFAGRLRSSGLGAAALRWLTVRLLATPRPRVPASESGAMVLAMPGHAHAAEQAHPHSHEHAHRHGPGGAHSHAIPGQDGEPVTWRSLIGLGIFGGMLPCPSAIVVMLSAISLHRVGFGLVLIVAFSAGLALVLTGIGFALVYGRALVARVPLLRRLAQRGGDGGALSVFVRLFPVGSAAAVVVAGAIITLRALAQHGTI